MNRELWLSSMKNIMLGVKLYYICGLIAAVFSFSFLSFVPVIGPIGKMAAGASVVGAFAFMYGAKDLKLAVAADDAKNVAKLHTALILIVCGIFIDIIPFIGWIIAPLVNLVGFIFMLLSYSALKKSTTFPEEAKKGAAKLYIAMIIACISAIISIIPVVGSVISAGLDVAVLILTLGGWKIITNSDMI